MLCLNICILPTIHSLLHPKMTKELQIQLLKYLCHPMKKVHAYIFPDFSKILSSFLKNNVCFFLFEVRNLQPKSFTKIAYNETLFEVSWFPPNDESNVQNYTIFWCLSENNRDRPYQVRFVFIDIEIAKSNRYS